MTASSVPITRPDSRGYSLVELLMATALLTLSLGALYGMLFQGQATFETQAASADLRQQARVALRDLTAELRIAGYNPKGVPEVFWDASGDRVSFAADIDNGDEALPCRQEDDPDRGVERVTYRVVESSLERQVECWDGSGWTAAGGIRAQRVATDLREGTPVFRYFDADGNELPTTAAGLVAADRARIAAITVTVALRDDEANLVLGPSARPEFRLASRVRIRNPVTDTS